VTDLISAIVSTYNRPDALDAVLRGLSRQIDRHFEIVVADDGSGPETAQVVARWAGAAGVPLIHVWREDRGFRLAEIRNRAILRSRGSYCVFLDGDCIPRPDFIAAHRRLAEPGWFVAGTRVLLSRDLTERVLREGLSPENWDAAGFLRQRRAGGVNRIGALLSLPLGPFRKLNARRWRGARGGNLAVFRRDLDRVDGFDASFDGWGREDSDIIVRLFHAGVRRKDGRFATAVLHLWHPENDRAALLENERRLEDVIASTRIRAVHGMSGLAQPVADEALNVPVR
jgi:glycosyltransferase involved in cell wall biosynthesis